MSTDTLDSMLRGVAATPSVKPPPRPGERLGGRYLIGAVIGQGGMGTVFRALDEKLGETVALKVMTGALDEQVLRDEVRLAQKVTHPNVCRTFDLEDIDGYHLVKMELVTGETLSARLLREPTLPIDVCVRIARAIASGLAAAHERKIVHGDLKPGNVMLDGERVVLMDFGIARLAADPLDGVRGTVGYMAPELVREGKADERADIYALGCVLYEMLTGEIVFSGASAVVMAARHASEIAPDVRSKRPDAPGWLAHAVARMLAKRPDERTVGLARLVSGPGPRARWILSGAVIATGVALGVWQLTRPAPWVPAVHDYKVFEENGDVMSLSPDGQWIAFASDRRERQVMRGYVMPVQGADVTPVLPEVDAANLRWSRDSSSILFSNNNHSFRQPIAGSPPRAHGPAEDLGPGQVLDDCGDALLMFSPGMVEWRVLLRFYDGKTSQLFATQPGEFVNDARCDPSGQHVVIVSGPSFVGGHNDVYLADRSRNVSRLTDDHKAGMSAIFTADGKDLVVSRLGDNDKLQLFEMDLHGHHMRRLINDDGPDRPCDVSRDGHSLVFMRDETAFFPVMASASGTRYLTRERGTFWFPREVRPDLVVATKNGQAGSDIVTIGVESGAIKVLAAGSAPFPSPDGRTIYFKGDDERTLFSIPVDGGVPVHVASLPGQIQYGNASADGLHVSVDIGNGDVAGFLIAGTTVKPEGTKGLVSTAPSGGWSAVTVYGDKLLGEGADLSLVPPGAALDHPSKHFHVASIHNRWLDDHRISYCLEDHCEILDVATDATSKIPIADSGGLFSSVMLDGTHVLDSIFDGRVTRHIITNFGDR